MNKGTAIISVLVAFVGGYFLGSYTSKGKKSGSSAGDVASSMRPIADQERELGPGNPQSDRIRVLIGPGDFVMGPADAPVTIVEFSDFQCPYCKRAADTVHQIAKEYAKDVRLVFKQNPLSFHKDAFLAAEAASAAGEQGKFWEMHDQLFNNQQKLDRASLEQYAQSLQLNMDKFRQALDTHKFKQQIDDSIKYAASVGARGTPTFFVNGKLVRGAQPFEQFKPTIDQELQYAKNLMGQKKVAAAAVYTEIMRDAKPGSPMAAGQAGAQPGQPDPAKTYKVPVADSPVKGAATAKLTVIEFSDFECPFCGRVEPTLKALQEKYGKDIRLVWKHQPLPMHPHAPLASEASMAAQEQGKFWEYHDKLFTNQKSLERPQLEQYAQELGLDMSKFKAALDSGKFKQAMQKDQQVAAQFGVRGTPAFFINGRPLRGAQPVEAFTKLCDEELAEANALLAKGIPATQLYDEIIKTGETEVKAGPAPQMGAGQPDPNAVYKIPVEKDDPQLGPATAKVTIVEWSDFQCPFCGRVNPTVHDIQKKYPKDVRVVFKQMPLPMHPNAPLAAEAAVAAQEQGKFWGLADLMFANQKALDRPSLESYAQQAGLDVAKFKAALDGGKGKAKVQKDMQAASQFGVRGTPTFFINGKFLNGAATIEVFDQRVKEEIGKADALIAKGTSPAQVYAALTKGGLDKVAMGAQAGGPMADTTVYKVDPGNAPIKGNPKAAVTIIEFSDFQCPFCGRVIPTIEELTKAYPKDVKLYFKQLPLPMHPNAPLAAEAALAAHEQGKFWAMHDKMFANQKALTRPDLEKYAQEIGLDLAKFKAALDSGKFKNQVEADKQQATTVGIGGTPAFLINGRKLSGALPLEQFKALVDEELAKVKGGKAGAKPAPPTQGAVRPVQPAAPAMPANK